MLATVVSHARPDKYVLDGDLKSLRRRELRLGGTANMHEELFAVASERVVARERVAARCQVIGRGRIR